MDRIRAGTRELRLIDPASKEERLVATGVFDTPPFSMRATSPGLPIRGHRLSVGWRENVPERQRRTVGGGSARPVSFLANTNAGSLSWSPDGAYLRSLPRSGLNQAT